MIKFSFCNSGSVLLLHGGGEGKDKVTLDIVSKRDLGICIGSHCRVTVEHCHNKLLNVTLELWQNIRPTL